MARYQPPTKVTTVEFPYLALVGQVDPDWQRRKYNEVEYVFSNRVFTANPYVRGSFNSYDNAYAVGQPYGALDPLVEAARPMYSGTPDGKGWA